MKLIHPYTELTGGSWLRGNLHAHSTFSDGARTAEDVVADYAHRGFGFLMLSDHDITTTRQQLDGWAGIAGKMILIPGNEVTANGPHLLHVDADRHIEPRASRQEVINQITAAANAPGGRGFVVVNHPNWQQAFDHATIAQMREWTGYVGMEIYNGVIGRLDGSLYATNKWDILLSEGRRIWGFANDDSHAANGDTELGWNTAYVKDPTPAGVVDALRRGRFYASTGVTISDIHIDGDRIRVETENAHRITALMNTGKRFATSDERAIEIRVPEYAKYVRFECWGAGERFAWTQPFFVEHEPRAAGAKKAAKQFIEVWQVSPLYEGLKLENAKPQSPETSSGWRKADAVPSSFQMGGFVNIQTRIDNQAGVIYLSTNVESDADRRARLFLGYDGPIRVWVNDQQIFEGPGTNPALPDQLALFANLRRGSNRLTIALDTNRGLAWGIYGRVETA